MLSINVSQRLFVSIHIHLYIPVCRNFSLVSYVMKRGGTKLQLCQIDVLCDPRVGFRS